MRQTRQNLEQPMVEIENVVFLPQFWIDRAKCPLFDYSPINPPRKYQISFEYVLQDDYNVLIFICLAMNFYDHKPVLSAKNGRIYHRWYFAIGQLYFQ